MKPSMNPNSTKYIDDPNYAWYGGRWMTEGQIERRREYVRERYANEPLFRLWKAQTNTIYKASKALARSIRRAEDL